MTYRPPDVWPIGTNWLHHMLMVFGVVEVPAETPKGVLQRQIATNALDLLDAKLRLEEATSEVTKLTARARRLTSDLSELGDDRR
jgi:hypothetical protein